LVGKQLGTAVGSYNKLVSSVDSRLVPGAKTLASLDPGMGELPDLSPLEVQSRESKHLASGSQEPEAVDAVVLEDLDVESSQQA